MLKPQFQVLRQFTATESPLKMMKNAFFHIKCLFCSWDVNKFLVLIFWSCRKTLWQENEGRFQSLWRHKLDNKQLQYTYCQIFQKVIGSANNAYCEKLGQLIMHIVKLGQLIMHIVKNIFLEKSCTKCGSEISTRPFLKSQNWAYFWINSQL